MDEQNDTGKPSVHGQFILDIDLSGRLSTDDAQALGQSIANSLAQAFAVILEATTDGALAVKGEVLCGWRVWGSDESAPLPSDPLRVPALSPSGGYSLTPVGIRWHDWSREGDDGGQVLPELQDDTGSVAPWSYPGRKM